MKTITPSVGPAHFISSTQSAQLKQRGESRVVQWERGENRDVVVRWGFPHTTHVEAHGTDSARRGAARGEVVK
jgi:hypothetical protein